MNHDYVAHLCSKLAGTTEDIKWDNDLCYSVGGKMYLVVSLSSPFTASFKVTPEQFELLTVLPGIEPAPYLARYHWILVTDVEALKKSQWEQSIKQSYQLVYSRLSKKVKNQIRT